MRINYFVLDIAAKTLVGEAVGEGKNGMIAVAHVILNRCKYRNQEIDQVCLDPWQFSCWNDNDPVRVRIERLLPQATDYLKALCVFTGCLAGYYGDPTEGADHYLNPSVLPKLPSWAYKLEPTVKIGRHQFYSSKKQKGE